MLKEKIIAEKTLIGSAGVNSIVLLSRNTLASAQYNGEIVIWNFLKKKKISVLKSHRKMVCGIAVIKTKVLNCRTTRKYLISVSRDKLIKLWSLTKYYCIKTLRGHLHAITCVNVIEDGNICKILTGSLDETVRIWNINCMIEVHRLNIFDATPKEKTKENKLRNGKGVMCLQYSKVHNQVIVGSVFSLCFLNENILIVVSCDGIVRFWDVRMCKLVKEMKGHQNFIFCICIFDKSRKIIGTGGRDRTIRIWNSLNGKSIKILETNTESVNDLIVHPETRKLIAASSDKTIKIYNTNVVLDKYYFMDFIQNMMLKKRIFIDTIIKLQLFQKESSVKLTLIED